MIKVETIGVWGFEGAIRGMRMPYESFDKSDSVGCDGCDFFDVDKYSCTQHGMVCPWGKWLIGENDMTLAKKLIKGGSEHRKFLRMIHVQAEVKAPRYWWAEAETYQYLLHDPIFYVRNSSSTMHLITKRYLKVDDFSLDKGEDLDNLFFLRIIDDINAMIDSYNDCKKNNDTAGMNHYLRLIKQELPESYNQLRMIDTNYECLLNIYRQRKAHHLVEWRKFCSWIEFLPYMKEFLNVQ